MVEAHNVGGNGNLNTMDSGFKAQQELEKIEQQIERLQALEGQNEETRRQVQQLHDRERLAARSFVPLESWERTEMARHPNAPTHWITWSASSPTGARSTVIEASPTIAIVCGMARFQGKSADRRPPEGSRQQAEGIAISACPNPEATGKRWGDAGRGQVSRRFHFCRYPGPIQTRARRSADRPKPAPTPAEMVRIEVPSS